MFQAWLGARDTAVHKIPLLLVFNGRCDQTKRSLQYSLITAMKIEEKGLCESPQRVPTPAQCVNGVGKY